MLTVDEVLKIAEEFAQALYAKLEDDSKLNIMEAISLAILLIRLIYSALKSNS